MPNVEGARTQAPHRSVGAGPPLCSCFNHTADKSSENSTVQTLKEVDGLSSSVSTTDIPWWPEAGQPQNQAQAASVVSERTRGEKTDVFCRNCLTRTFHEGTAALVQKPKT